MRHRLLTVAATTGAAMLVAAPAFAHTTANPSSTAAGAYAIVTMRVPHGCEGAATTVLDVSIPAGVTSVKPEQVPGWSVTTEIGSYAEPVTIHGQEITEGVVEVTWTADDGVSLPDAFYRDFGLSVKLPDTVGETLYFPAVQTCEDGSEAAWIEIPSSEGEELEKPAPAFELTAAEGGHGHDAAAEESTEDAAVEETAGEDAAGELTVVEAGVEDDSTDPMVWVALAVGLLGLAFGAAGFARGRKA